MTESRRTPVSSEAPFYTCKFPGCPFPVSVSVAVVEELQRVLRETAEDCQGLLYGAYAAAGTEVRGCRPISSFQIDAFDKAHAEAGRDVVGCYRIRSAATLQLSAEELAIAEARFSRPGSVVLLVRHDTADSEANFFFAENGKYLNVPLLSLPFDASRLQFTRRAEAPPPPLPAESSGRRRWGKLLLGFAAVVFAGAGGVLVMSVRTPAVGSLGAAASRPQRGTSPTTGSAAALPLTAERQGKDLKLAWASDSPGIAHAVSGILDIQDGGANRRISLDMTQIRFGNLLYAPVSDQVTISLTALQEDGTAQKGAILVILGTGSGPGNLLQPAAAVPARRADVQAVRPFVAPPGSSTPAGLAPVPGEDMPAAILSVRPAVALPATIASPPAAERPAAPVDEAAFVPPVLVFEAGVRTPPALRGFEKRPVIVKVRVVVDEAGRVVTAKALQQQLHNAYLQAAEAAAQRCRFRPARRGNAAVGSEVVLNFRFMPDQ